MAEEYRAWTTELVEDTFKKIVEFGYQPQGRNSPFYDYRNQGPTCRQPNLNFSMTKDELMEAIKCKKNIVYFAETFCEIKSEDGRYHKITLRDYQKEALEKMVKGRYTILLQSRQTGKCITGQTKIRVQDPNGEEYDILIGDLFTKQKFTLRNKIKSLLYKLLFKIDQLSSRE